VSGKKKPVAFQLYPRDLLADPQVAPMTLEEFGAYVVLLCHAWMGEGLPDDHKHLARLLKVSPRKFKAIWQMVGPCWHEEGGRLYQKRMEEVRREQRKFREKQSNNGKKKGQKGAEEQPE